MAARTLMQLLTEMYSTNMIEQIVLAAIRLTLAFAAIPIADPLCTMIRFDVTNQVIDCREID